MGYRDNFYVGKNIIDYTGDLNNFPTVYFMNAVEHGRITQQHKHDNNIGRNKVRSVFGYSMRNEDHNGKIVLVERESGRKHRSRNRFIPADEDSLPILIQAIVRFPDKKDR